MRFSFDHDENEKADFGNERFLILSQMFLSNLFMLCFFALFFRFA